MLKKFILFFSVILVATYSIQIDFHQEIDPKQLLQSQTIQISLNLKDVRILPGMEKNYYTITAQSSRRRRSIKILDSKYELMVKILKQFKLIKNKKQIIKNEHASTYNTRNQLWKYRLDFLVEGELHILKQVSDRLRQMRVYSLVESASVLYLQQKWASFQLATSAIHKILTTIQKYNLPIQIEYIDQIKVQGIDKSNKIQQQLLDQMQQIQNLEQQWQVFDQHSVIHDRFSRQQEQQKLLIILKTTKKATEPTHQIPDPPMATNPNISNMITMMKPNKTVHENICSPYQYCQGG